MSERGHRVGRYQRGGHPHRFRRQPDPLQSDDALRRLEEGALSEDSFTYSVTGADGTTWTQTVAVSVTGAAEEDCALTGTAGGGTLIAGPETCTSGADEGSNRVETPAGEFLTTAGAGHGNNGITTGTGFYDLFTGSGDDVFSIAGGGNNTLLIGEGWGNIRTLEGGDTIRGSSGDIGSGYSIDAGAGENVIEPGRNAGTEIWAGSGDDLITRGCGDHEIRDTGGGHRIITGDGHAMIITGDGNDTITVGDGFFYIAACAGDNRITTGSGDETLTGGAGDGTMSGGEGYDAARYAGTVDGYVVTSTGCTLTFTTCEAGAADAGTGLLCRIEALFFGGCGQLVAVADPHAAQEAPEPAAQLLPPGLESDSFLF
ncbi:calcium-binding protein [Cribrihabitans pelagius]|uniref:calcium-binding protein n=1 Tax=Cribrihabitans pelagius TaxID=1765746 RepID=UPI003B5CA1EF